MSSPLSLSEPVLADKAACTQQAERLRARVGSQASMKEALEVMNASGYRAALVVNEQMQLLGLLTDRDIRLALLAGYHLESRVSSFMNPSPLLGYSHEPPAVFRQRMQQHRINVLPIVDADNRVQGLSVINDFVPAPQGNTPLLESDTPLVIMAGGKGQRLLPLTQDTPKPLLPVGERPLLGHLLERAQQQGFSNVWISTHHQAEKIEAYLRQEPVDGLQPRLLREDVPMGTAGAIKAFYKEQLLQKTTEKAPPVLVMNGDILTTLSFQEMIDWHRVQGNKLTVACKQYSHAVPYGVLEYEGQQVTRLTEKPVITWQVNAGIYLIERAMLSHIPDNRYFDMTDLIDTLLAHHEKVGIFPVSESWIDIGKPEDYERVHRVLELQRQEQSFPAAGNALSK